jgi:peptide deformylase
VGILTILEFPDERLRKKADPVKTVDLKVKQLVDDMLETMYSAKGIGLAATQVNIQLRVIVLDTSEEKNTPLCLINPVILEKNGGRDYEEGCLSVPGFFENVSRADTVKIKALDKDGVEFEMTADGLLATCIQHEIDHLEGKLFVDYLSSLKRQRIKAKLEKIHRLERK